MNFIHLPELKELTRYKKIERCSLPKEVVIPLCQHTGTPSEQIVNVGDEVKRGSLIARKNGFISSNIHSSVSGKVLAIEDRPHPIVGTFKAIVVASDGQDIKAFSEPNREPTALSKEEIVDIVKEAGVVGLGGAMFPTYVKLTPPDGKKIDTLIINGAECEPFLTCDHQLMLEKSKEIIMGAHLLAKVLAVKDVIIGVEDNKMDVIEALGSAVYRVQGIGFPPRRTGRGQEGGQGSRLGGQAGYRVQVKRLKTRYPQGGEKQIIKTLLNREVPSGGLPMDIGCVVNNVQTVFSIYEAVYLGKPLYERVITVSGSFLKESKNVLVRIGTSIKDLLEFCGLDFKRDVYKIVMGGPMTGICQYTLDAPIIKGTSGILVLDKRFKGCDEVSCIRCSRCIDACPVGLMPCMIGVSARANRFDIALSYNPLDCIECGSCSYVCPSMIPLVQLIKLAKTKIKK